MVGPTAASTPIALVDRLSSEHRDVRFSITIRQAQKCWRNLIEKRTSRCRLDSRSPTAMDGAADVGGDHRTPPCRTEPRHAAPVRLIVSRQEVGSATSRVPNWPSSPAYSYHGFITGAGTETTLELEADSHRLPV